jgi:pilus assembly protein CpaB
MKSTTRYLIIAAIIASVVAVLVFRANSNLGEVPITAPTGVSLQSGTPEPSPTEILEGPLSVPSGKIAISVELSDPAKVGSFLRPGLFITVFNTVDAIETAGDIPAETAGDISVRETRVLLTKVQVLGIAGYTAVEEVDATITETTMFLVTLAVTQNEAERLVHAIQTGTLYFGLLSADTQVIPGAGVNDETIFLGVN